MNYGEPWDTTADAAFNTMLAGTTDEIDPATGKPRVKPQNTATTAPATVPAATPAATTAPINAAPAIGSAVQTISKESGPDLKYTSMGASLGSMIGPWGTAIGAVGGLIADVVSSDTANKAEARTRMDNYKEAQKTWTASADPALADGYNQFTPGQEKWYHKPSQNFANGGPTNPPNRKQMYNDSLTLYNYGADRNLLRSKGPLNDEFRAAHERLTKANGVYPEYNLPGDADGWVGYKKPTLIPVHAQGRPVRESAQGSLEKKWYEQNSMARSVETATMNPLLSRPPLDPQLAQAADPGPQRVPARTFQGGFADPAALKHVLGSQNKQLADEELLTPSQLQSRTNYANGGQVPQAHVVPGAQQAGAQVLADAAKTTPMTVPGTGSPTSDGAKLPGAPETQPAVSPGEAVVGEGQFQDMGLAAGAGRDQLQEMLYPLSAMDPMGLYAQGGPASTLSSYIPNYSSHIDPSKNYVETAAQQDKAKTEEPKKDYLDTLIGSTLTTNLIGGGAALLHNATSKRTPLPVAKAAVPALPNLNTGALNAKLDSDRARAVATAVHNTRGTQSVGRDLGIVANDQQARTTNTMAVEQVQNQESLAQAQVLNQFALYNNQQSNQMRAQNAMLEQQHRLMKGDAITRSLAGLSQSTSNALNAKMSDMERATRDETMKRYVDYVRGTSSVSPYA